MGEARRRGTYQERCEQGQQAAAVREAERVARDLARREAELEAHRARAEQRRQQALAAESLRQEALRRQKALAQVADHLGCTVASLRMASRQTTGVACGEPGYLPYCGRCPGLVRMVRGIDSFVCAHCGLMSRNVNGEDMFERTAPHPYPVTVEELA